jgi:hypothetical protein
MMPLELTEQQQRSLDATAESPPRVVDPRSSATYVLIPVPEYEAVREILEDERQQRAIRAIAKRNAVGRTDADP